MSDWAVGPFLVIKNLGFTNHPEQDNFYCNPFMIMEDLRCAEDLWRQLDFEFSDVTGAADWDFGSDGHFNVIEDAINPLQDATLFRRFGFKVCRAIRFRSHGCAALALTMFSSCSEGPVFPRSRISQLAERI